MCRIKLLEAIDHIVEDKAESERPSKKKKKKLKGRKKKTVPEPPPAASEDGGVEQEAVQVGKKILMARTENLIHDPFEQTEEVKVGTYSTCTYTSGGWQHLLLQTTVLLGQVYKNFDLKPFDTGTLKS